MTELIESETGQGQLGPMSPRSPSPPHSEAMVLIFDFTKIVTILKIELWFRNWWIFEKVYFILNSFIKFKKMCQNLNKLEIKLQNCVWKNFFVVPFKVQKNECK